MKATKLKNQIIEKFGSLACFANHSQQPLESWIIFRTLNGTRQKDREELLSRIRELNVFLKPEARIPQSLREYIRRTILIEFGSFAEFNRQFPEFTKSYLSGVVNGTKVFLTPKVRSLVKILIQAAQASRKQERTFK